MILQTKSEKIKSKLLFTRWFAWVGILVLAVIFFISLFQQNKEEIPSVFIGRKLPKCLVKCTKILL